MIWSQNLLWPFCLYTFCKAGLPFPLLLDDWAWRRFNPLQHVKQGSRALLSAGRGQGGCCAQELICPRASKAATMPPSACFQYASPHFLLRKHIAITPFCIPTRLPFIYLCLLLYGLYWHVCVIPLVCIHPLREEKTEVSIADLLKGKRDSHCFFPSARLLCREQGFNSLRPNDFFVHCKFCNGFFTGRIVVSERKNVIRRLPQSQKVTFLQGYTDYVG